MLVGNLVVAIEVLRQYDGGSIDNEFIESDHDVVWLAGKPSIELISDEVIAALDELGLRWSEEYECWEC